MESRTTTASACTTSTTRSIQQERPQQQQQRYRRRCNFTVQQSILLLSVSSSYCCYSSTASASEACPQYTHHQHRHASSCVLPAQQIPLGFLYSPRGGSTSRSGEEQSTSQDGEEDKELDAYIESLIATADDTSSEAEEASVEVEVEPELDDNVKAVRLPQSNDSSPDDSSSLVDNESNERVAIETIETAENIPMEQNDLVIEEDEEEEESDDEEIDKEAPVIEEEDEEEEEEDEEEEEEIDEEEDELEVVSETATAVEGEQEDDGEDDDESDNEVEEEEDVSETTTAENNVVERKQVIEKEHEDDNEDPAAMEEDAVVTNDPALAHAGTGNDMQDSPKETMSRPNPQPPNPVYLFLLRRGTVGHVLAMGLVLVVEWIQTYLPTLARFLAWLWFRLAPTRLQQGTPLPRRRRRPNPPTLAVSNPRTAQSGKMRKKLTQQADQQALAQLKRVGSVRDAKYRHVSMNFLQRHGLGPFSEATSSSTTTDDDNMLKTGSSKTQDDAEEEDDAEWVMQALTKDKTDHQPKKSSLQPTVSIGIGSGGPSLSVGVQFGSGGGKESKDRRSSLIKAATTSTVPRKKRKVPRSSDRDGGSGVVGRIRAVTGANSRVSRSLFGAYPGDAVSNEEAASAKGVVELARKYGYGDWSEDDDDRDDEGGVEAKHRRVKSRHRRQHKSRSNLKGGDSWHSSSNTISAEWKSSSSGDRSKRKHTHSRRSGSSSKRADPNSKGGNEDGASHHSSRSSARRVLPNYPLASSSVLGKKSGSYSANDLAKANTIRPAMERVRHVRRKASSKELKEDD
jgi:hypothetical protein